MRKNTRIKEIMRLAGAADEQNQNPSIPCLDAENTFYAATNDLSLNITQVSPIVVQNEITGKKDESGIIENCFAAIADEQRRQPDITCLDAENCLNATTNDLSINIVQDSPSLINQNEITGKKGDSEIIENCFAGLADEQRRHPGISCLNAEICLNAATNDLPMNITQDSPSLINQNGITGKEDSDIIESSSTDQVYYALNPGLLRSQRHSYETRDVMPDPRYVFSPINSGESDVDLSDIDPTFNTNNLHHSPPKVIAKSSSSGSISSSSSSSSDSSSSTSASENVQSPDTTKKRGRKKTRNPQTWKQNKVQKLRNSGKPYTSLSTLSKSIPGRSVKPPCTDRCRLKCKENIQEESRLTLFNAFWELADLYKQRMFIGSCMTDIQPKYRYTNAQNPRCFNKAYHFTVENKRIRVCKTFFKRTLDITDRMIQTTKTKYDANGMVQEDLRGRHENHKKISAELVSDIKEHINSIPRIESHYLRSMTSREYIDGSKTIVDLYKDFEKQQVESGKDPGKYGSYYKIFTTEFNLGFFQPKKDQCDLCMTFQNASTEEKEQLKNKIEVHLREKQMSRIEKDADRQNISATNKVVVYDLQAVMSCPDGDTSSFYYKSKLNSYNFTLTNLVKKDGNPQNQTRKNKLYTAYDKVDCFFWTETDGKRGANEIGSCIYNYLQNLDQNEEGDINVIFYSDNCCGQNKNKYVITMYMYAIHSLDKIKSITHKFLIKGHSQNEADNVHSLIEKEIKKNRKSGPIYCPQQYIALIKNAKKSKDPFVVHELTYDFFKDLKLLQEQWGYNYNVNDEGENVTWNEIKVIKITKDDPFVFYYKNTFDQKEFCKVILRNKRKKLPVISDIYLHTLYSAKLKLAENKKKDLLELISKKLIPSYYVEYYNTIL